MRLFQFVQERVQCWGEPLRRGGPAAAGGGDTQVREPLPGRLDWAVAPRQGHLRRALPHQLPQQIRRASRLLPSATYSATVYTTSRHTYLVLSLPDVMILWHQRPPQTTYLRSSLPYITNTLRHDISFSYEDKAIYETRSPINSLHQNDAQVAFFLGVIYPACSVLYLMSSSM